MRVKQVTLTQEIQAILLTSLRTIRGQVHLHDLQYRIRATINRGHKTNRDQMRIRKSLLMDPGAIASQIPIAAMRPVRNHLPVLQNIVQQTNLLQRSIRVVVQNHTIHKIAVLLHHEAVLQKSKTPTVKTGQLLNRVTHVRAPHRGVLPHQEAIPRAGQAVRKEATTVQEAA